MNFFFPVERGKSTFFLRNHESKRTTVLDNVRLRLSFSETGILYEA